MISFTILTTTPGALANNLVTQGVLKQATMEPGVTRYVGVFEGLEWVEVPNPIVSSLGPPVVMDTRHCYLVKIVRAALADQVTGADTGDLTDFTKLGTWIKNNSTVVTLTSADGRSWPSRQVGTNFWLVQSPDFGVWQ